MDEPLREIQLNGKQLVFLFMAAAVVSVVIFLCGVLVGRGVRAQVNSPAAETAAFGATVPASASAVPAGDRSATPDVPPTSPLTATDASKAPLTYYDRLDAKTPAPETLSAAPPAGTHQRAPTRPHDAPAQTAAPSRTAVAKAPPPAEDASLAPPGGSGYTVQVAALRDRREADGVARRLLTKGYRAYVIAPAGGHPAVFRVRVGKFKTRADAQVVATRLRKEEKFKPWITR